MDRASKNVHFEGKWEGANKQVEVKLSLIIFEDSGSQVVYCPALDVYGYGVTEKEALDSFKVCLGEFLKYTLNIFNNHNFKKIDQNINIPILA